MLAYCKSYDIVSCIEKTIEHFENLPIINTQIVFDSIVYKLSSERYFLILTCFTISYDTHSKKCNNQNRRNRIIAKL